MLQQEEFPFDPATRLPARIVIGRAILKWPVKWQWNILMDEALSGRKIPDWLLTPIDYNYRPASYWDPENLRQLVANIKGAERKKRALQLIEAGRLDEANELTLADTLTEEERAMAGKVHPAMMGGEYLPDYHTGEVEIARVTMASTNEDEISIRAYPKSKGIGYRVVNEYNSVYEIKLSSSKRPLSLQQLIRLINTGKSRDMGPIGLGIIQINFDCCPFDKPAEAFADFMSFSSEFYRDLSKHYWFATQRWVRQNQKRNANRSVEL